MNTQNIKINSKNNNTGFPPVPPKAHQKAAIKIYQLESNHIEKKLFGLMKSATLALNDLLEKAHMCLLDRDLSAMITYLDIGLRCKDNNKLRSELYLLRNFCKRMQGINSYNI